MFDMILKGGTCVTPAGALQTDIAIKGSRIAAIGDFDPALSEGVMDVSGLHVLPGVIDTHVHLCEPGLEQYEDLQSGTAAAALGGVTSVFALPDTIPPVQTAETLSDICRRAKNRVWTDISFFVGAHAGNAEKLADLERAQAVSGLYLNDKGIDNATLTALLASGNRRMAISTEDVSRVLKLAKAVKRRVHFLDVNCPEDLTLIAGFKELATVSCTLPGEDMWHVIDQGIVDSISSAHAPHLNDGLSAVQTVVPVLLNRVHQGELSLVQMVDLCCAGPARIFNVAAKGRVAVGYDADFTIVDLKATRTITDHWMASKIGKTPYNGVKVTGWPVTTIVRGHVIMHEGQLLDDAIGEAVRFTECL